MLSQQGHQFGREHQVSIELHQALSRLLVGERRRAVEVVEHREAFDDKVAQDPRELLQIGRREVLVDTRQRTAKLVSLEHVSHAPTSDGNQHRQIGLVRCALPDKHAVVNLVLGAVVQQVMQHVKVREWFPGLKIMAEGTLANNRATLGGVKEVRGS